MPQVLNRELLLQQLEAVTPGLSPREIIEQSSCFVFLQGKAMTYNDEIACAQKCDLQVEGAVQAEPLLAILRKLPEDELEVYVDNGELRLKGKNRRAGIRMEEKVHLPVDKVEVPKVWKPLSPEFLEGVTLVQHCTSNDDSQFALTCVHLMPEYLEAANNFQVTRVTVPTGISKETLVRRNSIKHIVNLGMVQYSETATWLHFRNAQGLTLSCRRYEQAYPDLKGVLQFKGRPIKLPRGLGEAADKANVFSADTAEENYVLVSLETGVVRVKGMGASGWFKQVMKLEYEGPSLEFLIYPDLLMEISEKYKEAEIMDGKLMAQGGKWRYITCLSPVATADTDK